jgi:hypothetical protein
MCVYVVSRISRQAHGLLLDNFPPSFLSTTENINPIRLWWVKATKGNLLDTNHRGAHAEAVKKAYTYHVVQSGKIIKSLGLTVSDFNTITRRLAHDPKLRDKVSTAVDPLSCFLLLLVSLNVSPLHNTILSSVPPSFPSSLLSRS